MADDQIKITLGCKTCGKPISALPEGTPDDTIFKCGSCGQVMGTWGEVRAKAREAAAAHLRDKVKGALKGLKGWKVK